MPFTIMGVDCVAAAASEMPTRSWTRYGSRCLLLWHLSSLDAPTVALVWALAFTRQAGVTLPPSQAAVLLLGTWVVYVLDRVLDSSHAPPAAALQQRHHFHFRHRRLLVSLCLAAVAALALLSFLLPWRLLAMYLALGIPVSIYAAAIHTHWLASLSRARQRSARSPRSPLQPLTSLPASPPRHPLSTRKEAAVATLFTAAVAAPALSAAPPSARPALALALLLLAPLCWLNCTLITHAESAAPPRTRTPLAGCAVALAIAAALACVHGGSGSHARQLAMPAAAVLLSSLLLLGLLLGHTAGGHTAGGDTARGQSAGVQSSRVRILADLALLTPLLFLSHHL